MELSTILIFIGIICMILSFFLKDTSKKMEQDFEEFTISIYQETNSIKKRLKIVEEELLLEPNFTVKSPISTKKSQEAYKQAALAKTNSKPVQNKQINEILVAQVIQLNKQGYPIDEISKMSTLTKDQILDILQNGGNR
ncbi:MULTISPECIES: hypothetical protein [Lysinibacillus]|uniref:Uncharacterized protein n=1 Tax=Lysinibacillus antri TaxID=2498145 RepID=A0A3S0RY33_9BACI|nr:MULTISPECIES: hypothetical protein [Lysinibacillus]RUL56971.1 hypothetical protein EK386_00690 [Lysinibacillus antri]TSI08540.1 hypothetical protein FJQ64_06185 [Lysinibacillus sp. BW-2-10]